MVAPEEFTALAHRFRAQFGREPTWFVRAPGRINLIGEHTDYNGFPVMPMAIERAIRLAAAPRDDGMVMLKSADPELYGDRGFEVAASIPPYPGGDWGNYAKAAVQSLVSYALEDGQEEHGLKGMSCLVAGDVPPAAGLSSSTALVVAAGLAFSAVNRLGLGRRAMADRMAAAEHYVGTQGGGMDQAVCLLGRPGELVRIDFFPLRARRVPFPRDCRIVAAHSRVRVPKSGQQRLAYNRRVLECRIAAHLLAGQLGMEPPERLADLVRDGAGRSPADMLEILERAVDGRDGVSLRRASGLFGVDPGRFAQQFLRMADGRLLPVPADGLRILPRCRHVFSEAARVEEAEACLRGGDLEGLGRLMDESHASCAADYEISCYELDQLVELMRGAGALGARLTGAGFGGFAIAFAHRDGVEGIKQALRVEFYEQRGASAEGNVFVFVPAAGALQEPAP